MECASKTTAIVVTANSGHAVILNMSAPGVLRRGSTYLTRGLIAPTNSMEGPWRLLVYLPLGVWLSAFSGPASKMQRVSQMLWHACIYAHALSIVMS